MKEAVIIAVLTLILLSGQGAVTSQNVPNVEITLSRLHSGSETLPTVNDYVQYDVSIKNTSDIPVTNQSLWVSFTSSGGKTSVSTAFSVQNLLSGESKSLHLGPFKLREAGEHRLNMGMNSQGNSSLPNEISSNYGLNDPVDRFTVFETTNQLLVPIIGSSIIAAAAVLIGISLYRNKKRKDG